MIFQFIVHNIEYSLYYHILLHIHSFKIAFICISTLNVSEAGWQCISWKF